MDKEKRNAYMREYHRRRLAAGLCVRCNGTELRPGRIYCSPCMTKESMKTSALIRGRKAKAIEYLGGKCRDCGGVFPPEVYEFDHPNNDGDRERSPSRIIRSSGWTTIKSFIDNFKLELVCSNCHVIRTSRRA